MIRYNFFLKKDMYIMGYKGYKENILNFVCCTIKTNE
jgi:hypothetical protein